MRSMRNVVAAVITLLVAGVLGGAVVFLPQFTQLGPLQNVAAKHATAPKHVLGQVRISTYNSAQACLTAGLAGFYGGLWGPEPSCDLIVRMVPGPGVAPQPVDEWELWVWPKPPAPCGVLNDGQVWPGAPFSNWQWVCDGQRQDWVVRRVSPPPPPPNPVQPPPVPNPPPIPSPIPVPVPQPLVSTTHAR